MTTEIDNPTRSITDPIQAIHPELVGKVAVITGAGRGMGATFARGLARKGVNVVAADINLDAARETAAEINASSVGIVNAGTVVAAAVDVRQANDHDLLLASALDSFGRVDFWINNAGIFPQADVLDITPEQFTATYRINVDGVLFGAQTAARHMRENGGGAIVNMASVAALRVRITRGAYSSSKAAVKHLTNTLAVELGPLGVRVNAIAPGFIDTEMTRWVHDQPGALDQALSTIPLRRIGSPEEVFGVLLFLLSDSARYVTGTTVAVDGGSQHI